MKPFTAEVIGTALMIVLGDGVVAGVLLNKTKAQNSGWMVITTGWAMGVAVAVYAVGRISGAHLNPAITLGLAAVGKFAWSDVPRYIGAQFIGASWVRSLYGWPIWRTGPKLKARLRSFPSSRPSPPSVDALSTSSPK